MGNPNVGKSAIFTRLTGAKVIISNYPGSTVEFLQGKLRLGDNDVNIIDVPGVYSLDPSSKADEIAVKMMDDDCIIINVIDATNLERNLFLTLHLLEKNIPMVIALNMWDDVKHKGINIDLERLREILGVPVVPTCALSGVGIRSLVESLKDAKKNPIGLQDDKKKWEKIGEIVATVQKLTHKHHTFLEKLEDLSIHPFTGLAIASVVVVLAFKSVRLIAEGLITYVSEPLFNVLWMPLMEKLSVFLKQGTFLHTLLIGNLIDGKIDFEMSFGVLTTGLFIQLAAILPYIFSFYFVLSLLEDFGYLPRLAILVDNFMHKIGLHGYAIIPMILGMGCKVPGILATRLLEGKREKFIASVLVASIIPCMSQVAMIIGLVGPRGGKYLAMIFGTLLMLLIVKGIILNRVIPGVSPEILIEIPPYRIPHLPSIVKKLWMRLFGYVFEAMPYVLLGVLIVNLMYSLQVMDAISKLFSPLITKVWGLPKESVSALVVGFLRKDVAVALLAPLNMTNKQLVIASTVLAIYFPCIALFITLLKELGLKDMLKATALMISVAILVGLVLNIIL